MSIPRKLVLKLGGSVLADEKAYIEQAQNIREIIDRENITKLYVVVSAQKGETDRLVEESGYDGELKRALRGKPSRLNYQGIADYLLQGEIRSVMKLDQYLRESRIDPTVLIQGQGKFPVIANHNYVYGTIDLRKSLQRRQVLGDIPNKVVLVAGFGAESPQGSKVLLGRNSSDLVAAVLARIDGHIDEIVYFKDVEGIYQDFGSDSATLVERMGITEARTLDLGKVLDKRSLDFASCDIRIQSYKEVIGSGTVIIK